jgi:ketosteroid isomerase-like protein
MRTSRLAYVVLLTFFACSNPRGTTTGDTGAVSTGAPVDRRAEEQTIRGLEQRWRGAITAKDSAAVGGFYSSDGYYLPQGSEGYEGPDKIRSRWASEFNGRKFELARNPKKIEVAQAGDMAYEVGSYEVSWDGGPGRKGQGAGNYVTVWKKENGDWKTAAYIWNRGEER